MNHEANTAYHEAGHAVIADSFGLPVNFISLFTESQRCSITQSENFAELKSLEDFDMADPALGDLAFMIVGHIAINLAGMVAEFMACGVVSPGVEDDLDKVCKILSGMGRRDPETWDFNYQAAISIVCQTLLERWKDVRRLAVALLKHRTLSRAQVEKILVGGTHPLDQKALPEHTLTRADSSVCGKCN